MLDVRYRTAWWFQRRITALCLWVIRKTNRNKDRCLSQWLFEIAEEYNTRPGTFHYSSTPFFEEPTVLGLDS